MKFLTLTLKESDSIKGYDFVNGEGDLTFDEIKQSLENVLFGNDALFDGEVLVTAEYDDKVYSVKRNFAESDVEVRTEGEILPRAKAAALVDELAALGRKQWRENLSPVDAGAFLTDCADYVEKRLAAMGFDQEELERRCLSYATERDRALSQVEILDELVADESVRTALAEDISRARTLKSEIDAQVLAAQADADRAETAKLAEELREELDKELAREEEINLLSEKLRGNATLSNLLPLYARVLELKKQIAGTEEELREVTSDLEPAEQDLNADKERVKEQREKYLALQKEAEEAKNAFFSALDGSADNEKLRAAILEKMGEKESGSSLVSYVEWDKKFYELSQDLSSSRLDYKTRRSIREGIAFETTIEDVEDKIKTLEEAVASEKRFVAALKEEKNGEEKQDFLTLYRAKLLCDVYRAEIAAEENKIRENEAAQKKIDSDVNALEKAKSAVALYVSRATEKCNELSDRLTGVAARKSFCADVTEMEYGAICPVCNNRITDKTDHIHEIEKLEVAEKRLSEDLSNSRDSLNEYSEKSIEINLRLGQLKEKRRLSAVYVDSLKASVGRKQDAVKELLEKTGSSDCADLEKRCASCARGSSESALASVLDAKIASFVPETEAKEKEIEELKETLSQMRASYENEIAPELKGERAYSYLESVVATEHAEDEKFAALLAADNARSQYLEDLIEGGDPERILAAANEVFHETLETVRQKEEAAASAYAEAENADKEIAEKEALFRSRLARADELLDRLESDKKRADELLTFAGAEDVDEETYEGLKRDLLPEDRVAAYEADISEHLYKVRSLRARIDALPKSDADAPQVSVEDKSTQYAVLQKKIADEEKVLAASDAAFRLAAAKTAACDELLVKYEWTKKLADGEISDVILPILNETLSVAGEKMTAVADGLGVKFSKKAGRGEKLFSYDAVDEDVLAVAVNCAFNFVTGLACGRDTVRLVSVDKPGQEVSVAKKYGVIEL